MFIKFDYIKFKNLISFGNKVVRINFKNGLSNISGKNGQGKSSIIDALSYNLYGVPYRKVKNIELINRVNKANLWTESQFEIGINSYKIERGLKPDILRIFKNGSELDLLSSKKLIQEEIDKILGVNHNLFRQIICLSVNYNKPYLTMSQYEKREVIESIFNVDVFGIMSKEIKKQQAIHKTQSQINSKQLTMMETNISSIKKRYRDLQHAVSNFEKDKSDEIIDITNEIEKYDQLILKTNENIDFGKTALSQLEIVNIYEIRGKIKDFSDKIAVLQYKLSEKKNFFDLLSGNTNCPVCGIVLTEKHAKEHTTKAKSEMKGLEKEIHLLELSKHEEDKKLKHAETNKERKSKIESVIEKAEDKFDLLQNELKKLNNRLVLVQNKVQVIEIEPTKNEMDIQVAKYRKLFKENAELTNIIKNNEVLLTILSDNGIKSHFFKKLIPILNSRINCYLDRFELPVIVKFNELMEENISSRIFNEISYMSFSEGEKKRIDLSIQFAFFDTARTISNWQSNIFFIDELLDSGMDTDGLEKIIHSLKSMTFSSTDLCIYLISHKLQEDAVWDHKIAIEKVGSFSKIVDENIDINEEIE
jgi:DNA repair exonuclease SbcCD ATPase subunit